MSESFKIQQLKTWDETTAVAPVAAQAAIDEGGARFLDKNGIGPKEDHYLLLESLTWEVVNSLHEKGFKVSAV